MVNTGYYMSLLVAPEILLVILVGKTAQFTFLPCKFWCGDLILLLECVEGFITQSQTGVEVY